MNGLFAFVTSAAIAIAFRSPLRAVPAAGLTGLLGWLTSRAVSQNGLPSIFGTFLGALVVGTMGELLARRLRKPAPLFVIPALFPLVPGLMAYNGMLLLAREELAQAGQLLTRTVFYAGAIAAGLAIPSALLRRRRATGQEDGQES